MLFFTICFFSVVVRAQISSEEQAQILPKETVQEQSIKKANLPLGRNRLSIALDANIYYAFTDKYDVLFDVAVTDIKHAGSGGRFGIEATNRDGFALRLLAGYQRIFYTDIGFQEIAKNQLILNLLFEYYFRKDFKKWDPYVFVGPTVLVSQSGKQGFLTTGLGVRYFLSENWSFRMEPAISTDFTGLRIQTNLGFNYHF